MKDQNENEKWNSAIHLMLEDLYTIHNDIRIKAKNNNCEKELNSIRKKLVLYLQTINNNA